MASTTTKSVRFPIAVLEALGVHLEKGIVQYDNANQLLVGLARYHLLVGGSHPVTEAIACFSKRDQDLIDDFLLACAQRGQTLRGQLLQHLIDGTHTPGATPAQITAEIAPRLRTLARRWNKGDHAVWSEIPV